MHDPVKAEYKAYRRKLRIVRREYLKAVDNALIFGIGAVRISADEPDFIRSISPLEFQVSDLRITYG